MESKLLKIIILPGSLLGLLTGLGLVWLQSAFWSQPWLWIKLGGVCGVLAYQGLSFHTHKRFARGDFYLSERQCRFINEIPTLCLFLIVIMVVVKPFI